MRAIIAAAVLAVLGATGAAVMSCVGESGTETFSCPNQHVFTGDWPDGGPAGASVSEYMSRRCGTLDCHGSELRSLRLYGQFGLRHPDESNVAGGKKTTLAELKANYAATCAIEPEKTSDAVDDQGQSAELLLIVQKARGIEAHKGGAVVKQGSKGDNCIAGWLRGDPPAMVADACQAAIDGL